MLPKIEGELSIREGKKSGWKKHVFVVRASGLYYSKAGRSLASKDIVRVVEWKDIDVYTSGQYKKFYRSPEPYCFSLVVGGATLSCDHVLTGATLSCDHVLTGATLSCDHVLTGATLSCDHVLTLCVCSLMGHCRGWRSRLYTSVLLASRNY